MGCRNAIYTVRNIVSDYVSKGNTVNVCAIDLSKAFDKVNHNAFTLICRHPSVKMKEEEERP